MSGSRGLLPALSPLRTGLETFTSSGSSLWEGLPGGDSRRLINYNLLHVTCLIFRITKGMQSAPSATWRTSFAFSAFIWLHQLLRDQRPAERLPLYRAGNIAPGIPTITAEHSLLSASYSSPPTDRLAVSLPRRRWDKVSTFRIIDHNE